MQPRAASKKSTSAPSRVLGIVYCPCTRPRPRPRPLGSSGEYADPGSRSWWKRMAEVMEVACDEEGFPRCKLHGLWMLDPVDFSHLPLTSADSCNVARNVGIDDNWGKYAPASRAMRALIMMDRIEAHASARRWCHKSSGVQQNMELVG